MKFFNDHHLCKSFRIYRIDTFQQPTMMVEVSILVILSKVYLQQKWVNSNKK